MEQLHLETKEFIEKVAALEALLFASGEGLTEKKIATVLDVNVKMTREIVSKLRSKYEKSDSGLELYLENGIYRLTTKRNLSSYLDELFSNQKRKGLSNAALEVLAIIASSQPITRAEIDAMRGVSCGSLMQTLLAKELIYCSGTLDKIGKPKAYSTTQRFLEVFEIDSLEQLPKIEEFIIN